MIAPTLLKTPIPRWQDLARLDDDELAGVDVALLNLAVAEGLPGGPKPEQAAECLKRLDHFACSVRDHTARRQSDFHRYRNEFGNSESRFRVVMMTTVLQKTHGIRYNQAKKPYGSIHTPEDAYIHGPLLGEGGTCFSVPVVYVAVARRLGYPIRLVSSKEHLFCRWEDPIERFNIDIVDEGAAIPPDDSYRVGKCPFSFEEECFHRYLRTKSPGEEFACFLTERSKYWFREGDWKQSVEAITWACKLAPENLPLQSMHCESRHRWRDALAERRPKLFPLLKVHYPPRRYPWMPEVVEREVILCETFQQLLDAPHHQEWWKALRRSPHRRPKNVPASIEASLNV